MSLAPSTVECLRGPFWYGYWIGRFEAFRSLWISEARVTRDPYLRKQYTQYARCSNRDLVSAKQRLRVKRGTT